MVEYLFPRRRVLARNAGAYGDLPCGAAPGRQHAQCAAWRDGRDASVVAGGRAVWNLRSPRALQRRLRRVGRGNRGGYFFAGLLGVWFFFAPPDRRRCGQTADSEAPCSKKLLRYRSPPYVIRTTVRVP